MNRSGVGSFLSTMRHGAGRGCAGRAAPVVNSARSQTSTLGRSQHNRNFRHVTSGTSVPPSARGLSAVGRPAQRSSTCVAATFETSSPRAAATASPTNGTRRGPVRTAPVRHRGEVGGIGLDEESIGRTERGRLSHLGSPLEGDDAAEREVGTEVETPPGLVGPTGETVDRRCAPARPRVRERRRCRPTPLGCGPRGRGHGRGPAAICAGEGIALSRRSASGRSGSRDRTRRRRPPPARSAGPRARRGRRWRRADAPPQSPRRPGAARATSMACARAGGIGADRDEPLDARSAGLVRRVSRRRYRRRGRDGSGRRSRQHRRCSDVTWLLSCSGEPDVGTALRPSRPAARRGRHPTSRPWEGARPPADPPCRCATTPHRTPAARPGWRGRRRS